MGIGDLIGSSAEFDYELFYRIMRFITTLEGLSFLDFSPPCASNDTQYKKYTLGDDHNNHCCELTSTDDTAMTLLVLLACKEYFNEKNPLSLITLSEKTMDLFFKDYLEGEKEAKTKNDAPSLMVEALPAVTVPFSFKNTGLSLPKLSTDVSALTPSSLSTMMSPLRVFIVTGTICSLKRPEAIAAAAF